MPEQHYNAANYQARRSIGYLTKRVHALLMGRLELVLERTGSNFMQYVILEFLREGMAANPTEIALQLGRDSGSLTRVIDQLADRGLVERLRRDRDRRKVELQLTPAGRKSVESVVPAVRKAMNTALVDLSRTEVEELTRLLVKLNLSLQAADELRQGEG